MEKNLNKTNATFTAKPRLSITTSGSKVSCYSNRSKGNEHFHVVKLRGFSSKWHCPCSPMSPSHWKKDSVLIIEPSTTPTLKTWSSFQLTLFPQIDLINSPAGWVRATSCLMTMTSGKYGAMDVSAEEQPGCGVALSWRHGAGGLSPLNHCF